MFLISVRFYFIRKHPGLHGRFAEQGCLHPVFSAVFREQRFFAGGGDRLIRLEFENNAALSGMIKQRTGKFIRAPFQEFCHIDFGQYAGFPLLFLKESS